MTLDREVMGRIAQDLYMSAVYDAYGEDGVETLLELLQRLRKIYDYVAPEEIEGRLFVFQALHKDTNGQSILQESSSMSPEQITSVEFLAQAYSHEARRRDTVIQLCRDGRLLLWPVADLDVDGLSGHGIVYVYHASSESFRVSGTDYPVPNPDHAHASVFSIPTFRSLDDALERYKRETIRTSRCLIFSGAWYGGEHSDRLFFQNGPEHIMRKSLENYLAISLRGTEVRPEQNVDESHPIDIKVTWPFSNRTALIEIKWLGKSRNNSGITNNHTQVRALEGAEQLAGYLDNNSRRAPTHETKGYLVIVDARRRGLNETSTMIDYARGMHYERVEIAFSPKYHEVRDDFKEPIRMFAKPVCRLSPE